jgi:ferric-dicitrate binding protein FerR (iron transport regulator)
VPVPLDPLRKVTSDEPTNNAVVPVDGKAVVGMVLGSVEVKLPTGLTEKISQNKQLPSDVELTTGEGKTVLVLPDGGLLYINHASNLTVSFRSKKELTVVLNAGEVTYKGSGTLTLTKVNVSVRNGKEVKVIILGNRLTLNVLEGNSKLANAKNSITVGKDMSSSISLNSEDAATKPSAISTPLDTWRDDLKLPNESIRKNLRSIHKSTK